jgi:hypothetical protein
MNLEPAKPLRAKRGSLIIMQGTQENKGRDQVRGSVNGKANNSEAPRLRRLTQIVVWRILF